MVRVRSGRVAEAATLKQTVAGGWKIYAVNQRSSNYIVSEVGVLDEIAVTRTRGSHSVCTLAGSRFAPTHLPNVNREKSEIFGTAHIKIENSLESSSHEVVPGFGNLVPWFACEVCPMAPAAAAEEVFRWHTSRCFLLWRTKIDRPYRCKMWISC